MRNLLDRIFDPEIFIPILVALFLLTVVICVTIHNVSENNNKFELERFYIQNPEKRPVQNINVSKEVIEVDGKVYVLKK